MPRTLPTGCFFPGVKVVTAEFADVGTCRVTDEVKRSGPSVGILAFQCHLIHFSKLQMDT